jgi:uncharacterized protein (TIGR03437 family)
LAHNLVANSLSILFIAVQLASAASPAADGLTTYTYHGSHFTEAQPPYTTSDAVTGYFTTGTLAPNLVDFDAFFYVTAFSFSDGVNTLDSSNTDPNPALTSFSVSTDSRGNITSWLVQLLSNAPVPSNSLIASCGGNAALFGCNVVGDQGYEDNGNGPYGFNKSDAGTWSVSSVGLPLIISSVSPPSVTAGGPDLTLTIKGSGFLQCPLFPCLEISWQNGGGQLIPGTANADATGLTVQIPADLVSVAESVNFTVQSAGRTSNSVPFVIVAPTGSPVSPGATHLLFPNAGINAVQEFDPVQKMVVNTIPLPAPFTYSGSALGSVRTRLSDGGILTNASVDGTSAVLALTSAGKFAAFEEAPNSALQQLAFDPLDDTQNTILAAGAGIFALNPYSSTLSTRISQPDANLAGIAVDSTGRIYTGAAASGQLFRYLPNGTQGSLFADVSESTGSDEIGSIAIDSQNDVYVAQGSANRIARFDSTGAFLGILLSSVFKPGASVFFNPNDGLLYVGDQTDDQLNILTVEGNAVAAVHMGGVGIGVPDVAPGASAAALAQTGTTLSGLTFQTPQGSAPPPAQGFQLFTNSTPPLSFTTKVSTVSGGSWLSVAGGAGSVSAAGPSTAINVTVNPSGLQAGVYFGSIEIDAASVTPEFVTVVFNVLAPSMDPGAAVAPTGLIFTAVVSGDNPQAQTIAVTNLLTRSTSYTSAISASTNPPWFGVSQSQGTIQAGQTASILAQAAVSNLPAGIYTGVLTLQFPEDGATRQIALLMVVADAGEEIAQAKQVFRPRQAAAPCTPSRLLMVFGTLGNAFEVSAGGPGTIMTTAVDDCGQAMTSGSVWVTFSNGDLPLQLASTQDGNWWGVWVSQNAGASVTVTATAIDPWGLMGTVQAGAVAQPNLNAPVLPANGVVSAASFSPKATPSPGELISLFGTGLAAGTASAGQLPLPTQLQNTAVSIGGKEIPLLYVSPTQINAVVPFDIAGGGKYQVIVRNGNSLSVPASIPVASADPAFFTVNASGSGQAYIVDVTQGYVLVDSTAPAKANDVLTMFCSGLGMVTATQSVTAGMAAPSPPAYVPGCLLTPAACPVSVTIGGERSVVSFAGLAPGLASLYQINATVPDGLAAGNQPVVITVGGVSSPVVMMAVR